MNPEDFIQQQQQILQQAGQDVKESNRHMESFIEQWEARKNHPIDDLETLQDLKLVLQYRLDTQNILSQLGHIQLYLLQILGVEPQHSLEMNLERLAFALGSDDLQHLLTLLNHLVNSVLKVLAHTQQQQALNRKKLLERLNEHEEIPVLTKSLEKLHSFGSKVKQLQLILEDVAGAPHPGVIYDHIAAMEGPISRFQQALNHGLALTNGLHRQLESKHQLSFQLPNTIHNTHQYIEKFQKTLEPHRLFTPTKENVPAERLEERAMEKRLGNFFNR